LEYNRADYHYNLAVGYYYQGQVHLAEQELRKSLKIDNKFEPALKQLSYMGRRIHPDWWGWWFGSDASWTKTGVGIFLLLALFIFLVLSIIYLVLPLAYGEYGPTKYEPGLDWQYYIAALAAVIIALLSPLLKSFKLGPFEGEFKTLEPQPPALMLDPALFEQVTPPEGRLGYKTVISPEFCKVL
jgi:hypothetical protein